LVQNLKKTPRRIGLGVKRFGQTGDMTIPINNKALATSGGYGTLFDRTGWYHHLIDPRTGFQHQSLS